MRSSVPRVDSSEISRHRRGFTSRRLESSMICDATINNGEAAISATCISHFLMKVARCQNQDSTANHSSHLQHALQCSGLILRRKETCGVS